MEKTLEEAFGRAIIDFTSAIFWAVDENLKLVYTNKNFNEYFSLGKLNFSNNFVNKVPEETIKTFYNYHLQVLETREKITRKAAIGMADGSTAEFHVELFPFEGSKRMVGGFALRLESSSNESKELQETNERLLYLVHAASVAIWEWDIKTGKTFRNKALLDMIGYAHEDAHDLNWWLNQIHPDDRKRVNDHIKEIIQKEYRDWDDTYQFKCEDGSYKYICDRGFIFYENGIPVKMIGSLRDITEIKELENRLAEERINKQREISENVIRVLEREKTLIGQELHDNINPILAVIKLYVGMLNPLSDEEKRLKKESIEQLNNAIEELRILSHELVIPQLKEKGLVPSIKDLIDSINASKTVKIEFSYDQQNYPYPLSSGKKVSLFRIVQEQLRNIMKHSKATQVKITLRLMGNKVQLVIQDNGIGFDPAKKIKGIGLSNIHERTEFYNGKVEIKTAEGKGCKLSVSIPLH